VPHDNHDILSDLKFHPSKLHRLLLCYSKTSSYIYSLNKNRAIQQVSYGKFDVDKGQAIACEFLDDEGFAIGFSSGVVGIYRAEQKGHKP